MAPPWACDDLALGGCTSVAEMQVRGDTNSPFELVQEVHEWGAEAIGVLL